jgi:hypothetical protein
MSLELFNSLATFGTFWVIAATAIGALVQLRHARSANLIEGISEVMRRFVSSNFQTAQHFVLTEFPEKWKEPEFRYQQKHRSARTPENQVLISKINEVGNTFENLGLMVKWQLIDRIMALDLFSDLAIIAWESLSLQTVALRRNQGTNAVFENFEYFVVLSQDWRAAHPDGAYPPGVRRIALVDELREADAQYAASRATA